jgi:purine catabolism regulator
LYATHKEWARVITVGDLLDEPALHLTLAAGREHLGNPVVAAHVSELTRPSPWLQGEELLMTVGLFLPGDAAACHEYVADCLRGGVSGLVLGLGAGLPHPLGPPPELVEAADDLGLPLLLLPDPIPFIAVTKWVFARLADEERREWQDAVVLTRDLTAAAARPDPLTAVLDTWAAALGSAALVTDLRGDPLASAGSSGELARQGRTAVDLALRGRTGRAAPVEADGVQVVPLGSSAPRGLLVLQHSDDPRGRHALAVLVSLVTLELDHRLASGNPERQRRAQAATQLLSSTLRPEVAPRLAASVGLPPGPLRVVVVRTSGQERPEDLATTLLSAVHQAVARPRTAAVDLLLPDIDDLLAALERAAPGHAVGISALARLGDLHVSARQADSLSQVSAHTGRPVQAEEGGATQLLLQLGPPELLTSYSDAVLAPLDVLEARERGELLHTLEEWLRANGAWEVAAGHLSVHRNTVRNRIARVSALLGRPLDADHRMELWLALQARAAVLRTPLRPPAEEGAPPPPP